jgi:hypothetical protein
LAGAASAGAAERAATAGAALADGQHGDPQRGQRGRRGSGPHLRLPGAQVSVVRWQGAVGAPLWSRAEGYHQLEEQPDGSTVLTFHETYHAYNPVLRFLLERPVHAKISRDNLDTYEHALGYVGKVRRLT